MKKLLIYSSILLGVGYLSSKAKEIYDNFALGFDIKNIRVLEISSANLSLTLLVDIIINNLNQVPIYVPVKINDIEIYLNGILVGRANIYKSGIYIPIGSPVIIPDVQLDIFFDKIEELYTTLTKLKTANISYKVNYEIAGNQFSYSSIYQH